MVDTLGTTQRKVYTTIVDHLEREGFAPTVREIGDVVGIRESNVHHHLKKLEEKGIIRRRDRLARSIEVVQRVEVSARRAVATEPTREQPARKPVARKATRTEERGIVRLPIRGLIAAGQPIEALDDRDNFYDVPAGLAGGPETYILQVRGTSMIEEHICDGDLVVIKPQTIARNGEIVVALVGDCVTLKKFYHEGTHIRLQPANATMEPIIVPADADIAIQGTVRAVIRQILH